MSNVFVLFNRIVFNLSKTSRAWSEIFEMLIWGFDRVLASLAFSWLQ